MEKSPNVFVPGSRGCGRGRVRRKSVALQLASVRLPDPVGPIHSINWRIAKHPESWMSVVNWMRRWNIHVHIPNVMDTVTFHEEVERWCCFKTAHRSWRGPRLDLNCHQVYHYHCQMQKRADQGERPSQPNRQTPLSVAPTLNSLVPSIMLGADGRLHNNASTV